MNGLLTEHWPAAREKLFQLHESGRIAITFDAVELAELEGVYDGIDRLLSGQSMGKVVVRIAPDDGIGE
jgi:hypothetical protein